MANHMSEGGSMRVRFVLVACICAVSLFTEELHQVERGWPTSRIDGLFGNHGFFSDHRHVG